MHMAYSSTYKDTSVSPIHTSSHQLTHKKSRQHFPHNQTLYGRYYCLKYQSASAHSGISATPNYTNIYHSICHTQPPSALGIRSCDTCLASVGDK